MKELTIEHIAPYLPYGLKLKSPLNTLNIPKNKIYKMYADRECFSPLIGILDIIEYQYRPILYRPETKQKEIENATLSTDDKNTWHIYQEVIGIDFFMEYQENLRNGDNMGCHLLEYMKLFEMKIDVFGLIDRELAIDVNELEENPYK